MQQEHENRLDTKVDVPGLKEMAASMDRLAKAIDGAPDKLQQQVAVSEQAAAAGYKVGALHGATATSIAITVIFVVAVIIGQRR